MAGRTCGSLLYRLQTPEPVSASLTVEGAAGGGDSRRHQGRSASTGHASKPGHWVFHFLDGLMFEFGFRRQKQPTRRSVKKEQQVWRRAWLGLPRKGFAAPARPLRGLPPRTDRDSRARQGTFVGDGALRGDPPTPSTSACHKTFTNPSCHPLPVQGFPRAMHP